MAYYAKDGHVYNYYRSKGCLRKVVARTTEATQRGKRWILKLSCGHTETRGGMAHKKTINRVHCNTCINDAQNHFGIRR